MLFIKDLLKHTTVGHPDHAPLQHALGELTALAEKVNASERERGRLEELRELLAAVDGLAQVRIIMLCQQTVFEGSDVYDTCLARD